MNENENGNASLVGDRDADGPSDRDDEIAKEQAHEVNPLLDSDEVDDEVPFLRR